MDGRGTLSGIRVRTVLPVRAGDTHHLRRAPLDLHTRRNLEHVPAACWQWDIFQRCGIQPPDVGGRTSERSASDERFGRSTSRGAGLSSMVEIRFGSLTESEEEANDDRRSNFPVR